MSYLEENTSAPGAVKYALAEARELAERIAEILRPGCEKLDIAGSIRREKAEVKDIEIVCLPRRVEMYNLFGELTGLDFANEFDEAIFNFETAFDYKYIKSGNKYKQVALTMENGKTINLDLFIAENHNYGYILALRTGDWEFSKALVTSRILGGLKPDDITLSDGAIYRGKTQLICCSEYSFFGNWGLANFARDIPYPRLRNADLVKRLRGGR